MRNLWKWNRIPSFLLLTAVILALCTAPFCAQATNVEQPSTLCFMLDDAGEVWSFAFLFRMDDGSLRVFSTGVESKKDASCAVNVGGNSYPVTLFENLGSMYSWKVSGTPDNAFVMDISKPVKGQSVEVLYAYFGEDGILWASDAYTIASCKAYSDGTGYVYLNESVTLPQEDAVVFPPGLLLDQAHACVGVLGSPSGAYVEWFDEEVFNNSSSPQAQPTSVPTVQPSVQEPSAAPPVPVPTLGPETILEIIQENMALVVVGIIAAGGIIFGILILNRSRAQKTADQKITSKFDPKPGPTDVVYPPPPPGPNGPTQPVSPYPPTPDNPHVYPPNIPVTPGGGGMRPTMPVQIPQNLYLSCTGGYYDGQRIPIRDAVVTMGRDPKNTIRFPEDYPGVSRNHAVLRFENGIMTLQDTSSTGTFLKRTQGRMPPNQPVQVSVGDVFYLGERKNRFEIMRMG